MKPWSWTKAWVFLESCLKASGSEESGVCRPRAAAKEAPDGEVSSVAIVVFSLSLSSGFSFHPSLLDGMTHISVNLSHSIHWPPCHSFHEVPSQTYPYQFSRHSSIQSSWQLLTITKKKTTIFKEHFKCKEQHLESSVKGNRRQCEQKPREGLCGEGRSGEKIVDVGWGDQLAG